MQLFEEIHINSASFFFPNDNSSLVIKLDFPNWLAYEQFLQFLIVWKMIAINSSILATILGQFALY